MSKRWINCDQRQVPYIAAHLNISPTLSATCLAEFEDDEAVAGTLYDGYNGNSIHAHIWIAPGRKPSRAFWYANFQYMFEQCGVKNVIGTVPASNEAARKLDEHLGFQLHTVIQNYYPSGDAMMLYILTPETAIPWRRFMPKVLPDIVLA